VTEVASKYKPRERSPIRAADQDPGRPALIADVLRYYETLVDQYAALANGSVSVCRAAVLVRGSGAEAFGVSAPAHYPTDRTRPCVRDLPSDSCRPCLRAAASFPRRLIATPDQIDGCRVLCVSGPSKDDDAAERKTFMDCSPAFSSQHSTTRTATQPRWPSGRNRSDCRISRLCPVSDRARIGAATEARTQRNRAENQYYRLNMAARSPRLYHRLKSGLFKPRCECPISTKCI